MRSLHKASTNGEAADVSVTFLHLSKQQSQARRQQAQNDDQLQPTRHLFDSEDGGRGNEWGE